MQETQLPARHTRFVPHIVPSDWFCPLSVQTALPVEQSSVPRWHRLLIGVQAPPMLPAMPRPLMQTMFIPHPTPSGGLPASTHIGEPVTHEVMPRLQGLASVQLAFA